MTPMRRAFIVCVLWAAGCGEVVNNSDGADPTFNAAVCFDGTDNESAAADGLVDCADPVCGDYATCIATAELDGTGVVVDSDAACPAGFEGGETLLHRGLDVAGTCEGCGCEVGTTTCEATIWLYDSYNDCSGDVGLSRGNKLGRVFTDMCPLEPIYYTDPGGIRVAIEPTTSCEARGMAALAAPSWAESKKFCLASPTAALGGGCESGHACVANQPAASQCTVVTGESACEGYATAEVDWYTGVDDARACGQCFCQAVGGGCEDTAVQIGSDYTCTDSGNDLRNLDRKCYTIGARAPYSPPAMIIGAPTAPVGCTAAATPSGLATPTGQTTLCCGPL